MGPAHGHTIAHVIEQTSEDMLRSNRARSIPRSIASKTVAGFVVLGLKREQSQGKVLQAHRSGKKQLAAETNRWRQIARAIGLVMGMVSA